MDVKNVGKSYGCFMAGDFAAKKTIHIPAIDFLQEIDGR